MKKLYFASLLLLLVSCTTTVKSDASLLTVYGSKEETLQSLENLYLSHPEVKEVSYNYAYALLAEGDNETAITVINDYLAIDEDNLRFLTLRLAAEKRSAKLRSYERTLDYILSIDPGFLDAHLEAAEYYQLWGNNERAEKEAWFVLERDSRNERALKVLSKNNDYFQLLVKEEKPEDNSRKRNPYQKPELDRELKLISEAYPWPL